MNGRGGLDDLELALLRTRLRHIEGHPDIMFESGSVPFLKKLGELGILEQQSAESLAEAANILLGLECVLSLTKDGKPDETQWEDPVKATIARACDAEEFGDVVAKAQEATARIAVDLDMPTA